MEWLTNAVKSLRRLRLCWENPEYPWHTQYMSVEIVPSRESILAYLRANLPRFRARYHVSSLGIFGSAARDAMTTQSDIDVIVDFDEISFDNFMDLKFELEDHFGRPVDLVTAGSVKPRIQAVVDQETVYA